MAAAVLTEIPQGSVSERDAAMQTVISAKMYHQRMGEMVRHLHSLLAIVFVTNMQHVPFLGIYPVFALSGLPLLEALVHWVAACVCIGLYTLVFAYFKAL
jgi:hypothetical protein